MNCSVFCFFFFPKENMVSVSDQFMLFHSIYLSNQILFYTFCIFSLLLHTGTIYPFQILISFFSTLLQVLSWSQF